ncbi:DUF1786 domain-containing protein [Chloroflexota bacterium]
MRLLAIDIGGMTQDILLFDTSMVAENWVKMILPSPTLTTAKKIEGATKAGEKLLFTGENMGSGPNKRAVKKHLDASLKVYATPEAATTFDDDLDEITRLGIILVSEEEGRRLSGVTQIETKDLDLTSINSALEAFDISTAFDALAVAVLDHGAAPPGVSDRLFRFQHLQEAIQKDNEITSLAYLKDEVPSYLTRMKAVAKSASADLPLLLMDTGEACALGALEDPVVAEHERRLVANAGNFHTIIINLHGSMVLGLFEHHTSRLSIQKLDVLITRFLSGDLTNQEVYNDGGHGCYIARSDEAQPFFTITGPRRRIASSSIFRPHFAAPYGDMMLSGCFGLVQAFANRIKEWKEEIEEALRR